MLPSFQKVLKRLVRNSAPNRQDATESHALLIDEGESKGNVDISAEATKLAKDLHRTIMPKKGVFHIVLHDDEIPKKGLPEIALNRQRSDVEISTAEYLEMVGPVLQYQSQDCRSSLVEDIRNIKNSKVKGQAIRAVSKHFVSFPKDRSKLIKELGRIPDNGIPAAASSFADRHTESPKPFDRQLPSNKIAELQDQLKKLHTHNPTFRVGDANPCHLLRQAGEIARQLPSAIEIARREQAELMDLKQNEIDGAGRSDRRNSATRPKQIVINVDLGDRTAREDPIRSRPSRCDGYGR